MESCGLSCACWECIWDLLGRCTQHGGCRFDPVQGSPLSGQRSRPLPPPATPQIASLLLLAMKQLPEALVQFDAHVKLFRWLKEPGRSLKCRVGHGLVGWQGLVHARAGGCLRCSLVPPAPPSSRRPRRRVPFEAPPGLAASHHAWLCRQYMVLAELLVSSGHGALDQLKV